MLGFLMRRVGYIDLDRFLNPGRIKSDPGFLAMRLDHELQRIAKIAAALVE